jgi:hypothetical protein
LEEKYCSNYNNSSYNIPNEDEKNLLTQKKGFQFTIIELEVWEIIENVRNLIV